MHLRLNGSKLQSVSPNEGFNRVAMARRTQKPNIFSRLMTPSSVSFVYVIRSELGLIKVGSCSDPLATIAQMRKESDYRLYIEYLGFTRADLSDEVAKVARGILSRHRVQPVWFDCEPEVALAATEAAAARLGYGMIATNLDGIEDILRNPSWVYMTRLRLRRSRQTSGKAMTMGLIVGALGLLAFAFTLIPQSVDLRPLMGPGLLVGMILALVLTRTRKLS